MRLQIGKMRVIYFIFFILFSIGVRGQGATSSNPLEYAAIGNGESLIDNEIKKQTRIRDSLSVLHGTMLIQETKMKQWEQKYSDYLKTAQGYASAIHAGTTLYAAGMETLAALWEIKTACKINPQGIAASVSMNNLYMETATELIKTYGILTKTIAVDDKKNMLNGKERTQLLWQLNSELAQLNKKFRALALSISLFTFEDVWNRAIAGKIGKSNKELAKEAHNRMNRAMIQVAKFYRARQDK